MLFFYACTKFFTLIVVFKILNALLTIATLGSYFACYVNPSRFPIAGFFSLALPIFIFFNLGFVLLWLVLGKKYIVQPLVILALGYFHISSLFQIFGGSSIGEKTNIELRVMTYNVQAFNKLTIRDWYQTPPEMRTRILDLDPDVLCMQEFVESQPRFPEYQHRYVKGTGGSGLAILSKYPIINQGKIENPVKGLAYKNFIFADILRGADTIRIVNIHLVSIALSKKDLSQFVHIENTDQSKLKVSSKRIGQRLYKAFQHRGLQVNAVADFIKTSPYPVILCGDFNDTPGSYTYKQFTNILNDSFKQKGFGFGTTHPKFAAYHAPLRIDHIMSSATFKPTGYSIEKATFTDHFPVVVDFAMPLAKE